MERNGYIKRLKSRFKKESHANITLSLKDEKASKVIPELSRLLNRGDISYEMTVIFSPCQHNQ